MSKNLTIKVPDAWGSRVGLVLAMAGNAVGFGNFLRFPVQAVQNGGGAFIIPYLVSLLILGLPLILIEWSTGRYGGSFGYHSTPLMMRKMGRKAIWMYVGVFGIFSNIAIASYYCYMESWTMSYVFHSVVGTFNGMDQHQVASFFSGYLDVTTSTTGIPFEAIVFFLLCLSLNVWILSKGLSGGIEKAAKIGVPLLIVFGIFLAIKGITLKAGHDGAVFDGLKGLNFLWTPEFSSLANPKVWLAAAGQIFFTLSVGMGCIQAYASYVKKDDDIACNAMSAGFMNEFVEIVLGSSIIIPIAVGYFGIDRVIELTHMGGLGLGFRTMPFLFAQWGPVMAALSGVAFFGLLFFAGITSSLAMGTPVVGFFQDEFGWRKGRAAIGFGVIILIIGLPTVLFFQQGVFDEYDYWAGTVALFVFAMFESIMFAWVFKLDKGWAEITRGSDIRVPLFFRFTLKYITPVVLIVVFVASLIRPANDDWSKISVTGWSLHSESILGQISHQGGGPNNTYFATNFYSEVDGMVVGLVKENSRNFLQIQSSVGSPTNYLVEDDYKIVVQPGEHVSVGSPIFEGGVTNKIFYSDMARIFLASLFLLICFMVYYAYRKRVRENTL
ncbi:sodium-dependent transporter [Williamwhitmania taraxaci]|uniref:Na+-dependent transporter, SNF family n=1 Tax=Williamwhitmania taraxaci TaxID=1640674 RepID=A0A1G6IKU2_9BACT|nr:sodium-dependent transporter [Williamwhitmania taraxaci]SDC06625.1 Na+-dependent transporter, SNF family [Williamwhitmania taraxaci]